MHEEDYVQILQGIQDLPFGVGKKLLAAYITGSNHKTIRQQNLAAYPTYASLAYTKAEATVLINKLLRNNIIEYKPLPKKRHIRVLSLTTKGERELRNPTGAVRLRSHHIDTEPVTAEDKKRFEAFGDFLEYYNDEQCKAITTPAKTTLCVAGAGTGKTTVLTKRIEFLTTYTGVEPENILAITFTRKARNELRARLRRLGVPGAHVATFNSFAEQLLQTHNDLLYDKQGRVASYGDITKIVRKVIEEHEVPRTAMLHTYYSSGQRRNKSESELLQDFVKDCITVIELVKTQEGDVKVNGAAGKLILDIANFAAEQLEKRNFRTHADQIIHATKLLREHKETNPNFEVVLVDEYQDVNDAQVALIDALDAPNLFCVGDPRQSIYGWRGSDVTHISDFDAEYDTPKIIALTKNYRSTNGIVELSNEVIKPMLLPDLEAATESNGTVSIQRFNDEAEEHEYVAEHISKGGVPLHDVFILARTKRQLEKQAEVLEANNIPFIIRAEKQRRGTEKNHVLLSTVHASKGLEATAVYVIGANSRNHPIKISEHPVIDQLHHDGYDRHEEERRLFYVAVTRAQKKLVVSYTGSKSPFLPRRGKKSKKKLQAQTLEDALKQWRKKESKKRKLPEFQILPNSALRSIQKKKPASKQELLGIWGVTRKKMDEYGDSLLKIMRRYT